MKGKILITPRAFAKSDGTQVKRLEEKGYCVHVNETGKSYSYDEFIKLSKDVEGIIIGVDEADENMLQHANKLKAIAKYGVGVDNIDLNAAKKQGIKISRTVGSNSVSVAEHAISLMFALEKNIVSNCLSVKNGQWDKSYSTEMKDKTIGIIGFGNIGKEVVRIAQGIGMNVYAHDLYPIDVEYAKKHNVKISTFEELITNSDVITVHLPLTETTQSLINKEVFKKMKPTSIIINAARGGVVNENDLFDALSSKEIAGAGFDVFSKEPPVTTEPLLQLDNFILTPHTASKTKEADENTMRLAVENIMKDLEGIS